MRIALITDLHGNEVALRAVIDHARARGVSDFVCLGDVATLGPRPLEVLAILRDLGCPCIMGNHDAFMVEPELLHTYSESPLIIDAVNRCRARMRPEDLDFIAGFEATRTVNLPGGRELLLYHGTPRSNMEDALPDTPADKLDEMLGFDDDTKRPAVAAGGHTHIQMLRQHRGTLVVNAGSLGAPFHEYANGGPPVVLPHAEYAIVEADLDGVVVHLCRVELDREALLGQLDGWDNPLQPALSAAWSVGM